MIFSIIEEDSHSRQSRNGEKPLNADQRFQQLAQTLFPGSQLIRAWPLSGGISAEMTALEISLAGGQARRLVVRQPGAAEKEYRLLLRLHALGLPVPEPLSLDISGTIFPTPYLVLEYIDGRPEFTRANAADTAAQLAAQLAGIHRAQLAPEVLSLLSHPVGVLPDLPAADPAFDAPRIHAALQAAWPIPRHTQPALLHGDFWPGNILWRASQIAAVVDWEDAAYGDPLYDAAITRLDLLWIFGREALQAFETHYFALLPLDTRSLPYWDLYAALRLARLAGVDLTEWAAFFHPYGRADITASSIRQHFRYFVAQAFEKIKQA